MNWPKKSMLALASAVLFVTAACESGNGGSNASEQGRDDGAVTSDAILATLGEGNDGILTDHGTVEALEAGVKKAVDKGIPVVALDANLKVSGVTVFQHSDEKLASTLHE
ncbi:hypothetical protein M3223_08505 [Paenibacillus pasadenensis]|uniref:hypothetical protein n=1 Tax=Paenibacillus pasadenensis TaxID=217090 RepID=UPI00203DFD0A|nr:hypothetical protein [Paenibacillus pasadenensis]MCM3747395.1 hypothetical protein [Paenibacillus pasadenensis]